VPNLSTRVPVGRGDGYGLGATGGEAEHKLTIEEMPSHDHRIQVAHTDSGTTKAEATIRYNSEDTNFTGDGILTKATGDGQPHNNMQPYIVVNYVISTGKGEMIGYAVAGTVSADPGGGAIIDDNDVTFDKTWSSSKILDEIMVHVDAAVGDIETALDGIIAIQNELIGGGGA
jgi:hypothetical protein